MRTALTAILGLAMVFTVSTTRAADKAEKKEVTLKGEIVCTKCELKETAACANAIKTKIDGKDVVVYIDDKGKGEKYHGKVCTSPAKGSVKGVLSEKDGKKTIKPSKDGVTID